MAEVKWAPSILNSVLLCMRMGCALLLYWAWAVAIASLTLKLCEASKLRSWLGPTNFAQGTAPSRRYGHGFAEVDGSFYVFGGFGTGQHSRSVASSLSLTPMLY